MNRSDRYINGTNGQKCVSVVRAETARGASEAPYRDYFAEIVAFVFGVLSHYAFRFAASAAGFVAVLLFTIGIAGGIELEVLPLACGVPLGVMLLCILGLLNRARK